MREVKKTYRDPLDEIWLAVARRTGFKVARTSEVYAGTDGEGTIHVGAPAVLDGDDCLAQMVFHELCHALIEGPAAWSKPDWGLDNQSQRDEPKEQACLRLQAALLSMHGLRQVLAPTTDHRAFYDGLGDPLLPLDDPAVTLARVGVARARRPPFTPHLQEALAATGRIVREAAPFAQGGDALLAAIAPLPRRHPLGLLVNPGGGTCGECAWAYEKRGLRCRQSALERKIDPSWPGCELYEVASSLDCLTCGACCREAYQSVTISPRDLVRKRHPELVVKKAKHYEMARADTRCVALDGGRTEGEEYTCRIYADRPRICREFLRGGDNCLGARRRLGMSR